MDIPVRIPDYLADKIHGANQGKRDSWLVELDSIIDQARRCFPADNHNNNPDASADYGATTTDYDLPAADPTFADCPDCGNTVGLWPHDCANW